MKAQVKLGNITYTVSTDDKQTYRIKMGRKEVLRTIQYNGGLVQYSKRIGSSWFSGSVVKDMKVVIMDLINEHYENEQYVAKLIGAK